MLNLDALERAGTISRRDLDLFHRVSTPEDAFDYLSKRLTELHMQPDGAGSEQPAE